MSFSADLQRGQEVEEKVVQLLKTKYPSCSLIDKFKGYDVWIPELSLGVEVKFDPMSNKTGNIVIEYEMNGKQSALMTTKAKLWVFYDGYKFCWLSPKDIIRCIFDSKLTHVVFTGKGDSVSKKAFLVKKDVLFSYGSETFEDKTL